MYLTLSLGMEVSLALEWVLARRRIPATPGLGERGDGGVFSSSEEASELTLPRRARRGPA